MNLYDIKLKSKELQLGYPLLKRMLIFIVAIELLPNLIATDFTNAGSIILAGIVLLLCTVNHGVYVITRKIIQRESLEGNEQYSGIKRFKELFTTYLLKELIVDIFMIAGIAVIELGGKMIFKDAIEVLSNPEILNNPDILKNYDSSIVASLTSYLCYYVVSFVILGVSWIIFCISLSMVPYVIEYQKIYNFKALKESMRLMKGYKRKYMRMYLSYTHWFICIYLVMVICNTIFVSVPFIGTTAGVIVGTFIELNTIYPNLIIREALFYQGIVENQM